jgi:hypothetical protein
MALEMRLPRIRMALKPQGLHISKRGSIPSQGHKTNERNSLPFQGHPAGAGAGAGAGVVACPQISSACNSPRAQGRRTKPLLVVAESNWKERVQDAIKGAEEGLSSRGSTVDSSPVRLGQATRKVRLQPGDKFPILLQSKHSNQPSQYAQSKASGLSKLTRRTLEVHQEDVGTELQLSGTTRELGHSLRGQGIAPALRANAVNWLIEVLHAYDCHEQTFFKAVSIMDRYFAKTQRYSTSI